MKHLSMLTLLALTVNLASAHYLNPATDKNSCSVKNYVEIIANDFDYIGTKLDSVYLYITKTGNANVTTQNPVIWDTSFYVTTTGNFIFYAKLFSSPETLFFREYQRNNTHSTWNIEYSNYSSNGLVLTFAGAGTIISTCSALPITLSSFYINKTTNGITATWTTTMESNNNYFLLEGSNDGKNFVTLAKVASYSPNGNSSLPHTYTVNYTFPAIAFLSPLLLLLFGQPTLRKKSITVIASLILAFVTFSCTKTNAKPVSYQSYSIFRLSQVDKDGNTTYYYKTN